MITNNRFAATSEKITEKKYTYQDITFDLQQTENPGSDQLHGRKTHKDIKVSYDEGAIMNSLRNIFTTTPGQKILNPLFGVNLSKWLFEPCDEFTGREIGEAILNGIEKFEPRVKVKTVDVISRPERNEYLIRLVISIPQLNIRDTRYDAILNQPGFDFLTKTET